MQQHALLWSAVVLHHRACCSASRGRLLGFASPAAAWICLPMSATLLKPRCLSSLSAGLSDTAPFCESLSSFKGSLPVLLRTAVHFDLGGSPAAEMGMGLVPHLTEGIRMAVVHHVKAAVHVHSHRRPLCRQVAAAPADCTAAGCVRLLLQKNTSTGCTGQVCRGLLLKREAI